VFISPQIVWFLEENKRLNKTVFIIENITNVIQFIPKRCFRESVENITKDRVLGDINENFKINAYLSKLQGNSAYGKFLTNVADHNEIRYSWDVDKLICSPFLKSVHDFENGVYEIILKKKKISWELPRYLGVFTYGYAKLHMLKFYYNFLSEYLKDSCFELLHMDTDSYYLALSDNSLRNCVKPGMLDKFDNASKIWLTQNNDVADNRVPGKFKVEFEGTEYVGLSSKAYSLLSGGTTKIACKGVNKKQNKIKHSHFKRVLSRGKVYSIRNTGIKLYKNKYLTTYTQSKTAFSRLYIKRNVLNDNIHTAPLKHL
jgi:hypothetical protein